MNEKRLRNILLGIIAGLLLLNLGARFVPAVQAVPRPQYKVVTTGVNYRENPEVVQEALNRESAAGWEYVSVWDGALILKK